MDLESPSNIQVKEKKIFKSVHKEEIGLSWSSESFEVKYNIGFGIPIEFLSQRKKIYSNQSRNNEIKEIRPLWSSESFGGQGRYLIAKGKIHESLSSIRQF